MNRSLNIFKKKNILLYGINILEFNLFLTIDQASLGRIKKLMSKLKRHGLLRFFFKVNGTLKIIVVCFLLNSNKIIFTRVYYYGFDGKVSLRISDNYVAKPL